MEKYTLFTDNFGQRISTGCFQVQTFRQQIHPAVPFARPQRSRAQNTGDLLQADHEGRHGADEEERLDGRQHFGNRVHVCHF